MQKMADEQINLVAYSLWIKFRNLNLVRFSLGNVSYLAYDLWLFIIIEDGKMKFEYVIDSEVHRPHPMRCTNKFKIKNIAQH